MLITTNELKSYSVITDDGASGRVEDILIEEIFWHVRYLVITIGSWLNKQEILLIPDVIASINHQAKEISLNLSEKQLRDSPPIERHLPISRQYEEALAVHYGWARYWLSVTLRNSPLPDSLLPTVADRETIAQHDLATKASLRSCNELSDYNLETVHKLEMQIVDLAIHLSSWKLRFLIINDSQPVSMDFVTACSWERQVIALSITEQLLKEQDPYLPKEIIGI